MDPAQRWEACGAAALTGRADGPALAPPAGLLAALDELTAPLGLDPLPLLTERARIVGLHRRGTTSCGGGTRLLRAQDGWIAVTLARPEDEVAVPAWLEVDPLHAAEDVWQVIGREVATRPTSALLERGELLELPVSALGEATGRTAVRRERIGEGAPIELARTVVVDLSSLWAGPLCGRLLAGRGATVRKVSSAARPDGARSGPAAFYELLNAPKEEIVLQDLSVQLPPLLERADVVIEASRPRALAQLGITPERFERPRAWVRITGYGAGSNRPAFGDDAAVAGGLVAWEGGEPRFCADAIADPVAGLTAAAAVVAALAAGSRWVLDVSMAASSAAVATPPLPSP